MPYHVAIGRNEKAARYQLDLEESEVLDLFVKPILARQAIFIGGVVIPFDAIGYFQVSYTPDESRTVLSRLWKRYADYEERARLRRDRFSFPRPDASEVFRDGQDKTLDFIKVPVLGQQKSEGRQSPVQLRLSAAGDKVFVVHGHDIGLREAVARFITSLGLKPIILSEQPNEGRTIIEKFEKNIDVNFAVVILSPDDEAHAAGQKKEQRPRARQNVILELGYFMGKLGRDRVCPLYRSGVELPSDIHGLAYVEMDDRGAWKMDLIRELRRAGLPVATAPIL